MCRKVERVHKCSGFFNKQGYNETNSTDKQKKKGSMRTGCKGHVKVKLDAKEGCWFFVVINLKYNHQLHPEKRMTHFIRSHKGMEDGGEKPDRSYDTSWSATPSSNERDVRTVWWEGELDINRARHEKQVQISLTLKTCSNYQVLLFMNYNYVIYVIVQIVCTGKHHLCVKRDQMISQSCKSVNEYFY
jgi:hypothetical protein